MKPKEQAAKVSEDEDADREKKEISVREEELQGYAGDYWSEELGATYRLAIANGKVKVISILDGSAASRVNNFTTDALRPTGTDEFQVGKSGVIVHFRRNARGEAGEFTLDAGRTKGLVFVRKQHAGN